MKRTISFFLCILLSISCCSGFVSGACMDEDELPGIVLDPDLVLPTRELRVLAPESWQAVYAYTGEAPFPGTVMPQKGTVHAMSISVAVAELVFSGGDQQTAPITLENSNRDVVIVVGEDAACQVYYGTFGDVSGDGKVNTGDVAKIYSHLRGSKALTDQAMLFFADATGDGRLNMGDVAKIYNHIKTND